MAKSIRIFVSEIEDVQINKREYQRVADTGNKRDNGAVYEYVEFKDTEKVETVIFKQEMPEGKFDLVEVIKAVNSIK